jgi:hypothetical protein
MSYTPGPWEVGDLVTLEGYDNTIPHHLVVGWIGGESGRTIADVGEWKDRPNAREDARLIAAAPDLLDALNDVLAYARSGDPEQRVISPGAVRRATEAVAKARGE